MCVFISKGQLNQKHVEKLREKIRDAHGGKWNKDEIEVNIDKHLTNVRECMKYRNLVGLFQFDWTKRK